MTLNDVAAELAGTHHTTVLFLIDSDRGRLWLTANLREALELYRCRVGSVHASEFTVVKPSGAEIRCRVITQRRLAATGGMDFKGYHDTPLFTETRGGWVKSEIGVV